jgi:tRNA-specific 2-thiouridylase
VQFIHAYSREAGKPIDDAAGDIVTESGEVLGRHPGVHNYTIGQRKGLGFSTGKPLYVLAIDPRNNCVVVGEDDSLHSTSFEIENVNWISLEEPAAPLRAEGKIRHKHDPSPATVEALPGNRARIIFDSPQRAITPGQAAAIYSGDVVLAGGWIK